MSGPSPQVKNKRWFAVFKALKQLCYDWTIQREGLRALLIHWRGQDVNFLFGEKHV